MISYIRNMTASKKSYKEYKKKRNALPIQYAQTLEALEKYMWNFAKNEDFLSVLEEILQMFQEAAIDNTPIQNIIGTDPVEFADTIMEQYPHTLWLIKSRDKLRTDIENIDRLNMRE